MTAATTARPAYVPGKGILIVEATSDPSVFLVHSQTEPNKKYTVAIPSSASPACECGDYMFRGNRCKHIEGVSQQIQEAQMSDQDWSSTPPTTEYSDPTIALYAALSKAQAAVKPATKDRKGQIGTQTYKYADLAAVAEAVDTALVDNGLAIVFAPGVFHEGVIGFSASILHSGGGRLTYEMSFPVDLTYPKAGAPYYSAQNVGKVLTYARRQAKVALLDMVTEDEDAEQDRGHQNGYQSRDRDTYQRETPAPRPAQNATRDNQMTSMDVLQSQFKEGERYKAPATGAPNLAQMMALCRNTQFPSTGMMGAFLAGSDALCAPTEELVEAWFDRNPGAQGDQLLTEAGAWYESQPWAVDGMKLRARKWREEQRVAA